ncbi:DNA repair protein RecN [bacterium]
MLKTLTIKNYALIEILEINFHKGLNIITGETGTGKSIILGALGLILGDRAKTEMIRQGAERAIVEAVIEIPNSFPEDFFTEIMDTINNQELIIRREVNATGRSRCFINDSPVPLALFTELGDLLIDLHGQHEHQALFKIDNHLTYLDNYGDYNDLLLTVKTLSKKYITQLNELNELKSHEANIKSKQELLAFQVQEIENVDPQPAEDEKLESEERILRDAEKLNETFQILEKLLYSGEGAVVENLSTAKQYLTQHMALDERFKRWGEECDSARISVQELYGAIQSFVTQIEYNPQRLEEIRDRLSQLILLKKKYGGSLEKVLIFFQNAVQELKQIDSLDDDIAKKTIELDQVRDDFSRNCCLLSKNRNETAVKLSKDIIKILMDLGLAHGELKINIHQKEMIEGPVQWNGKNYSASIKGMDQAEFLISLNPGEDPKPLRYVASGGEISRIMLAIKTILASTDNVPILVFDEIDTGISGRIARVVGKNLKHVSEKHQIICITHLPQIASLGDIHFTVEKEMDDGRTRTTLRQLNDDDRVIEIAKLLGGETITETTLENAKELLL